MSVEQQVDALATSVDELTGAVVTKKAALDASVVDAQSATAQAQDARTNALSARDEAGAFKEAAYTAAQSAASAVAYQDLTALAETKAITAVDLVIYDTAKDSDGGAWRHRCAGTSWYREPLNTATRGARRAFPAVAVIVAEADRITIYDGDDPALPMWIVLQGSYFGVPHRQGGYDYKAVAMVNGMMAYTGTNQGLLTLDFIRETSRSFHASTTRGGEYSTPIAQRGVASLFPPPGQAGFTLPSSSGNDLAMTVLPDAPMDQATGLPAPTIAVATEGGVSVIKDDGAVTDGAVGITNSHVAFDKESVLYSRWHDYHAATFPDEFKAGPWNFATRTYRLREVNGAEGPIGGAVLTAPSSEAVGTTVGLSLLERKSDEIIANGPSSGLVACLATSTYSTGWLPGDIKGAFLSDTDDTDLVGGVNLIADTSMYPLALTSGAAHTNTSANLVEGRFYRVLFDIQWSADAVGQVTVYASTTGLPYLTISADPGNTTTIDYITIAEDSGAVFGINATPLSAGTATVVSPSVELADADRSVNNNGLVINGTVTRSPVATGADLVAYSGFSASNYLEQPYNPDLDFGIGDFCVMGWVKTSLATGNTQCILERGDAGAGGNTIKVEINATGALLCQLSGSTVSGGDISSGQFSHACFTKRGGTLYLHVNGDEISTLGAAGKDVTNTDALVRIGQSLNGGRSLLDGSLALWRISATAPSAAQIKRIYEDERPMFQEGASCTLYGAADEVTALAHDPSTGLLHVGTPVGRSVFRGLRRVAHTTTPVTTAIAAVGDLVVDQ